MLPSIPKLAAIALALLLTPTTVTAAPLPCDSDSATTTTTTTNHTLTARDGPYRVHLDTPSNLLLWSNDESYTASAARADLAKLMAWAGDSAKLSPARVTETLAAIFDVAHRYYPELPTKKAARAIMADIRAESDFDVGNISPGRLDSGASVGLMQVSPDGGSAELTLFQHHARTTTSHAGPLPDYRTGQPLRAETLSRGDLMTPWVNVHVAVWIQANLARSGSRDPYHWGSLRVAGGDGDGDGDGDGGDEEDDGENDASDRKGAGNGTSNGTSTSKSPNTRTRTSTSTTALDAQPEPTSAFHKSGRGGRHPTSSLLSSASPHKLSHSHAATHSATHSHTRTRLVGVPSALAANHLAGAGKDDESLPESQHTSSTHAAPLLRLRRRRRRSSPPSSSRKPPRRTLRTAFGSWVAGPADSPGGYLTHGDDVSAPYLRAIVRSVGVLYGDEEGVGVEWLDGLVVRGGVVDYQ